MCRMITAGFGITLVALLAAGCGGGGGDDQLSRAEFMKQARTVCAKSQRKLTAMGLRTKIHYKQLSGLLSQESQELEAIEGPDPIESRIEPLIENVAKAGELVAREKRKAVEDPGIASYKQEAEEFHLDGC